ncbi:MAG TPA: choice-of-anchor tandem repeat GloVer-containing protein, partial [Gemmataceae bacterium]|nr:choice-of-anchor tandem repeat GloVer-containing protein [Gemmataceae bacterium]
MTVQHWLRKWFGETHGSRPRTASRRSRRTRLQAECLEQRCLPSFMTLASFAGGSNGSYPLGDLIVDSSGNLFGTTTGKSEVGPPSSNGTVFEVHKGSGTATTLATFNGANGAQPYAGLVADSSGNLFGTTHDGGASGVGTVFKVQLGSSPITITTFATFTFDNGRNP